MGFAQVDQAPLVQGRLGAARVSVLGAQGVRLTGLNSFHLDEGPDFAWLNIYRTLTAGRQLEITRERQPAALEVVPGGAQVRWEASGEVEAELSAFYAIVEGASAAAEALFRDGRWLSARAKLAPRSLLCLSADHPGAPLRTRHCADGASARVFWHFGL